jgi:hypothetical protein
LLKRVFKINWNIPQEQLLQNTIGPADLYLNSKFRLITSKNSNIPEEELVADRMRVHEANQTLKALLDENLRHVLLYKCNNLIPKYTFTKRRK